MIWLILAIAVGAAAYFFMQKRPPPPARVSFEEQKRRARLWPKTEQDRLASDVRDLALAGYDRGSDGAKAAGKDVSFSHQVGVLEAAQCVLADDHRHDDAVTRALQMETIPFNEVNPALGRIAVAEYLVWKFFPDEAKMEPLSEAMREFTQRVFRRVETEAEADQFLYRMIYSQTADWQRLAVLQAQGMAGNKNG